MLLTRNTILKGPGYITYDSATIHSEADITVDFVQRIEMRRTSAFGRLKPVRLDGWLEIMAAPTAWSGLAVLYPYASHQVGARIYGDTDKPLVITPMEGASLTVVNAAVRQMPAMRLHPEGNGMLGAVTWRGLVGNGLDPALDASYFAFGLAGATLGTLTLADLLNETFTASWNAQALIPDEAIDIAFSVGLDDQYRPDVGTYDARISEAGVEAVASLAPSGLSEAQLATMLSFAGAMGSTRTTSAFAATGSGGVSVTLNDCYARAARTQYGPNANRVGNVEFVTSRAMALGQLTALWSIS